MIRFAPCWRVTFFARAKKVTKAFYLKECAPDEAFPLRSDVIVRAAGLQGEELEHPVPNLRLDSPCLAPAGLIAQ